MTDDLRRRLEQAFAVEHREHVDALRVSLAGAEAAGWHLAPDALTEIHRRLHSFKGAARAMDFRPLERAMHRAETLAARLQSGAEIVDADMAAALEILLDDAERWVADALAGRTPGALDRAEEALGPWLEDKPVAPPAVSSAPVPDPAADAGAAATHEAVTPRGETVRVDVGILDTMLTRASSLGAQAERQRAAIGELRTLADGLDRVQRELDRAARPATVAALKGDIARLHELAGTLADANWHVRRHGARIDQVAHESRLVAAEQVLFDLARHGRQIARDEGKDVAVGVTGLDVRADRGVLQALKDPLAHLVRNAIVHGIEPPDARSAAGKEPRGRVTVALALRGRSVQVRVADDGRGIDATAVGARARALGLVAPDEDGPAEAALLRLVTQPGLSTAPELTELSGRGMGLSVVDAAVRRLGGYAELASTPGKGTSFTLSVPSVVARRRLLTFDAGGELYALPLDCVRRVRRAAPDALVTVEGRRVVRDSGGEMPAVSLHAAASDGPVRLIEVTLAEDDVFALVVDAFGTIVDRIVEDAGVAGTPAEAIIGCAAVEGSRLVAVLNPVWLRSSEARRPAGARPAAPVAPRAKPVVLIADDSITTRTLEKSLLEARGYRVLVAVDGHEALAQLGGTAVDVVIADVEMPRTDGFALVEAMKADSRLAGIPVILVTSRDADSDRRRGLALGADAYIVKQRFDERELVETIEQLV